jgi:hypothetical protein
MLYDPIKHEYDGGRSPSVTTILKAAGYIDDRWMTEEARDRGSAVHTLCERYANGERFDAKGRELASLEYVNAFAAWMRDTMAYAITTECIIHHTLNGRPYAGRFDLLAEITRKRRLVDLKTGAKAKWHKIQLAAYALAKFDREQYSNVIDEWPVNPDQCSCLYLRADGNYKEDRASGAEMVENIALWKDALAGGKTKALIDREFKEAMRREVRNISFYGED